MSAAALLLIAGAALGFASLDLLRKVLADRMAVQPLLFWMTLGPMPAYLAWFLIEGPEWPAAGYWGPGLLSVAVNVLANAAFLRAMQVSSFSATVPLLALTPVFTSLVAVPLLREIPTPSECFGILLVVAGAVLLQATEARLEGAARVAAVAAGAGLMLVVAVLWSVTTPLDKVALRSAGVPFHALALHLGIALTLGLALRLQGRGVDARGARRSMVPLVLAVVAGGVALACQLSALTLVPAGLLETLKRGLGSAAALVFGVTLFGERLSAAKALAVAVIVAGVALVLW